MKNMSSKNILKLSVLIAVLALLGFTATVPSSSDNMEYQTLVVQYHITREGYPYQELTFSSRDSTSNLLYLLDSRILSSSKTRRRFIETNHKQGRLINRFDNSLLHKEIGELLENGWTIHDHDFALGKAASDADNSQIRTYAEYVSYFLFERSK
ncbi:MAG: hypothetical protein AAF847_17545 [Bacteroidota bacterium]